MNRRMKHCLRPPTLAAWILLLAVLQAPLAFASTLDLFSPAPPSRSTASSAADAPASEHVLALNLEALQSGAIVPGTLLRVEPAPGVVFTARVERASTDVAGTLGILAPLVDREYAFLILSFSDGIAHGAVQLPDEQRRYAIRFDPPARRHVARDVPDAELDELPPGPAIVPLPTDGGADDPPALKSSPLSDPPVLDNTATPATIDVLIVYTPAAASWASSYGGGIANVVNQAMLRAQQAMDNSSVGITFRLVHSAQISYTESGNSNTDLSRLQNTSDGHMDAVHTWRNTYGADLVALLANVSDTGGLGFALTSPFLPNGFPTYAFSLNRVQQVAGGYTLVHEMGHNMGAGHHKLQNVQPGPQLQSYSAGWRWTGTNGSRYCSVMTYASGQYFSDGLTHVQVGYFSSPSVSYQGVATGHAADGDNARTLRETKHLTAAYRAMVTKPFWLRAVALDDSVMLRWEDPLECGFSSSTVMLRFSTTDYPAATNAGTLAYQGTARQFLHTNGIVSRQPHYYSIWLSDDGSTFVQP
jgi:hypothetical protein